MPQTPFCTPGDVVKKASKSTLVHSRRSFQYIQIFLVFIISNSKDETGLED